MPRPKKPPRLWKRGDRAWIIMDGTSQISTRFKDRNRAEVALAAYVASKAERAALAENRGLRREMDKVLSGARWRSKKHGRALEVSTDDLIALYQSAGGKCSVTGIPFRFTYDGPARRNPYGASLDRIDCAGGYTKGNVRLVLTFVNNAISDFGDETFLDVIASMWSAAKASATMSTCAACPHQELVSLASRADGIRPETKGQLIDWLLTGRVGISSKAIASFMCGHMTPPGSIPSDSGDVARCEALLDAVPEFRERFAEMANAGAPWAAIVPHWDEIAGSADASRIIRRLTLST